MVDSRHDTTLLNPPWHWRRRGSRKIRGHWAAKRKTAEVIGAILLLLSVSSRDALAQAATPLPRIIVSERQRMCPLTDTPEARRLWTAFAGKYSRAISSAPPASQIARFGGHAMGTVLRSDLGSFGEAEASAKASGGVRSVWRGASLASAAATAARKRFERGIYAERITAEEPRQLYQPVYWGWYYTRLDENFVDHLIDSSFAARHQMEVREVSGGSVLNFCGRDLSRPWIEGSIALTRDTLVSHLAVSYFTQVGHEDAKTEVWFDLDAPIGSSGRHLWPERSIFYRRTSNENVWFQEAWINQITCLWHDADEARAGRAPVLASRADRCDPSKTH